MGKAKEILDIEFADGTILRHDQGDEFIFGTSSADTLDGGNGQDMIHGGAGADHFILAAGDGDDVIFDFSTAEGDHIEIEGFVFADLTISNQSGNAVVTYGTDSVTLKDVSSASLVEDDFVFV